MHRQKKNPKRMELFKHKSTLKAYREEKKKR